MAVEVVQPHQGKILHLKSATLGYRFEWHPISKKLYFIKINPSGKEVGHCFAENVEDHGQALMYCFIWQRGFKEARENPPLKEIING